MQSRNAYILGSFTIPEGATSGTRIEFDAENGLILVYDSGDNLIASIAPDQGTTPGGTYYARGVSSYGGISGTIAILSNSGTVRFEALPGNDPYIWDAEIVPGNPGVANPQTSAALSLYAPETKIASGGGAYIRMKSASKDNTKKGMIHYGFTDPDTEGTHGFQGYVYAEKWSANTQVRENWKTLSYAANWADSVPAAGYRLFPDGTVRFRGVVQKTTAGVPVDGTVFATLPVGYRPAQVTLVPIACDASATKARLEIATTGAMAVFDMPNNFPCLDGVWYGEASLS